MARAYGVAAWQGESIKGKLHDPEPLGLDVFDPRRCKLTLYRPSDIHPPLTLAPNLCVREDMVDLVRSIGIITHPFDQIRWFRVPHDPEAIEHGKVQWPPPHKSWIGQHPEVKRDNQPHYYLGIPPQLPFKPVSQEHLYQFVDVDSDRSKVQLDPNVLRRHPVWEVPGALVVTSRAPEPFLDMVADEEHFKVLPFVRKSVRSERK